MGCTPESLNAKPELPVGSDPLAKAPSLARLLRGEIGEATIGCAVMFAGFTMTFAGLLISINFYHSPTNPSFEGGVMTVAGSAIGIGGYLLHSRRP